MPGKSGTTIVFDLSNTETMEKIKATFLFVLAAMVLSSCQAIGNIFSAGVWVGLTIALIVIIIFVAVFRKKS